MNAIAKRGFDVEAIRAQFPILSEKIRGKDLVFLDSAASAQKPRAVIDAMVHAMEHQYANVHRGLHWMSERTTDAYEGTRDAIAGLINAPSREEIVFTKNATEAFNLVAHSYGRGVMKPGQAVVISSWSTTRTSSPGRCSATAPAAGMAASSCGFAPSRTRASWTWKRWNASCPTAGSAWSRWRT